MQIIQIININWIKFGNHKLRQQIRSGTQQLFLPDQPQSTNAHFSQINQN